MRDRHWKMLMQTTGKHFVMDDKFALGDLLALELHNYVDACSEIVDRAQKELNIEKQIKKIEDTWAGLNLQFVPYMDTDIMSLLVSGEPETLVTNMIILLLVPCASDSIWQARLCRQLTCKVP